MINPNFVARRTPEQWEAAIAHNRDVSQTVSLDGGCQITHGRYFWPLEPQHPGNDYDIETVAHALSTKIRWSGFTAIDGRPTSYSVAQHSVHVADIVNLNRQKLVPAGQWDNRDAPTLCGLLHDASEAWIDDIVRPVKYKLAGYIEVEKELQDEVYRQFNCPVDGVIYEAVRRVDNMMIFMERDKLMGQPVAPYMNEFDHPHVTMDDLVPEFRVWSALEAKERFIDKYEEIVRHAGNRIPLEYLNRGYTL